MSIDSKTDEAFAPKNNARDKLSGEGVSSALSSCSLQGCKPFLVFPPVRKLRARFFIHNSGMRMTRMLNARVFLFRIPIPEWTERHSIHSAPRGRMNRMLRMKIQDGGRRD